MIKWKSLTFGPVNLWNCPRQTELDTINADKAQLKRQLEKIQRDILNIDWSVMVHDAMQERIKEREFLYYLHSGRFVEVAE